MAEYRVCFSKGAKLQFISHLELIKAIERAIRRAGLPLVYSEGFHPLPKISFGPALAVGINSIDEYFDLRLLEEVNPVTVRESLNQTLPEGLEIIAAKQCRQHAKPLNAVINRAAYLIELEADQEDLPEIIKRCHELMSLPEIFVNRNDKNGQKLVNIRPWLHNLTTETINKQRMLINFTGEIGSGGNLRPNDILSLIFYPVEILNIARIGLWRAEKEIIFKPMDLC